jgi:hypothetical protein
MSEYGFGYYDGDAEEEGQQAPPQETKQTPEPKWFRDYMKKSSQEINELRGKLAAKEVAEKFQAKGYDPTASALYQGDPDKVDEWLAANGTLLAKRPGAEQEEIVTPPTGAPASAVSAEHQEQFQRMQSAGDGAAAAQGSEAELVAALNAAKTVEDFENVARANGWQYSTDGLFG